MKQSNVLALKSCVPCKPGTSPLTLTSIRSLLDKLHGDWKILPGDRLRREFLFPDFRSALKFTELLGEIAERENHHPLLILEWGKVTVELFTHAIRGLTESDFILAAKYDAAFS